MLKKLFKLCSIAGACAFGGGNGGGHNRLYQLAKGNGAYAAAQGCVEKLEFLASEPIFAVDRARVPAGDNFSVSPSNNDNGD